MLQKNDNRKKLCCLRQLCWHCQHRCHVTGPEAAQTSLSEPVHEQGNPGNQVGTAEKHGLGSLHGLAKLADPDIRAALDHSLDDLAVGVAGWHKLRLGRVFEQNSGPGPHPRRAARR